MPRDAADADADMLMLMPPCLRALRRYFRHYFCCHYFADAAYFCHCRRDADISI